MTLSHVDKEGAARIVDVVDKPETLRSAVAESFLVVAPATLIALREGRGKGDPKEVARLAALQAAKHTSTLIPLCHPLRLHAVEVDIEEHPPDRLRVVVRVRAVERTGVEMEALTAAAVGTLTLYDMVKAVDRGATITDTRVLEKHGGRSGDWVRPEGP